jgi:hypothetical protein
MNLSDVIDRLRAIVIPPPKSAEQVGDVGVLVRTACDALRQIPSAVLNERQQKEESMRHINCLSVQVRESSIHSITSLVFCATLFIASSFVLFTKNQAVVRIVVELVICWGILPTLEAGVGLPLSKRPKNVIDRMRHLRHLLFSLLFN